MNTLKKLWCVLFIMAFSMPALASTPLSQLASFDDIAAEGWYDDRDTGYMLQAPSPALSWSDGFESGNFTAGGWTTQDANATVVGAAKYTGTYGAKLAGTTWIEKRESTEGYNTIIVRYRRATTGLDPGENLYVEWSVDGSTWDNIETVSSASYDDGLMEIQILYANNNANFRIRFRTDADLTSEYAYIDDVEITGTSTDEEAYEGTGSMRIAFTDFVDPNFDIEPKLAFDPLLNLSDQNLGITLWVWTDLVDDSKLWEIILYDDADHVGRFAVPTLDSGWSKVTASLRSFVWDGEVPPEDVNWGSITTIGLSASCYEVPGNDLYFDDMWLEIVSTSPVVPPYQIASFDDIETEGWYDDRETGYMLQESLPGEVNEGEGSMKIAFSNYFDSGWDIEPDLAFDPPLNLSGYQNQAITLWLWTDPEPGDNISYLNQIILYDDVGNRRGCFGVPVQNPGWQKVTANLADFAWYESVEGGDDIVIPPSDAHWGSITQIGLFASCYNSDEALPPFPDIYMDDMQLGDANYQPVLSDARIVNADFGTITVDGNAADWAALDDSDVVDFDLAAVPIQPNGNLHVQYRLAWDNDYLYILVEELPGDLVACEANQIGDYGELWSLNDQQGGDVYYDELALYFDFTNDHANGTDTAINLWLFLGLNSKGSTDMMMAWTNSEWDPHKPEAITNGSVATSGTLGSRITEAKVKWSDLDSALWRRPEGGFAAAVKPGYIFGCDPRLNDLEGPDWAEPDSEHGSAWLNGNLWSDQPSGRDIFSTDVRLVCSAGDLDGDCDVDFVDYAQFAEKWFNDDCTNLNGFCNGADIVINGQVNMEDLAKFTQRWLD